MTLADNLKATLYRVRAIPGQLGLRPHTVVLRVGAWSGPHTGDGSETLSEIVIQESGGQPPKVRWLTDEQVAVGSLAKGSVKVGPITPDFAGGGTDLSVLIGEGLEKGNTVNLIITGPKHPNGARYRVTTFTADRAMQRLITAEPLSEG